MKNKDRDVLQKMVKYCDDVEYLMEKYHSY